MNVIDDTPVPEAEVPVMETAEKAPALRVVDRCDACSAQAFVSVAIRGTLLLFCGHDYAKHEAALVLDGGTIQEDQRRQLLAKPAV